MAKFTAKEDFRSGDNLYEIGNTYDSAKYGIDDATVERWYNAGWCEVEGKDPAPERKPGAAEIKVGDTTHG